MLAGKLAFVTGAGSGIGRATCIALAKEGAKVAASDINEVTASETIKFLKDDVHQSFSLNVSDSSSAKNCFKKVKEHFHQVPEIVVNCAGILRDSFLLKMTEEQFKTVVDVNLMGTFILTQLGCAEMIDAGVKGSIINISSIVAKTGNLGQANYTATKAAVEAFSLTTAKEMGRYGIRCNCVMPGFIESPMTDGIPDKVKTLLVSRIPLARMGTASEVAEVIVFLASDKSSYINGATIPVTGGA